ncbi:cobalt ECF transporter T component CbiQ [Amaricoccus tamworthensis]|uniref:cobalt ECF transporter T component CbiQ n=1 Tax=Amaricoccus tamworthensis TaxID=57002 RepID=UPI003C7E6FA1
MNPILSITATEEDVLPRVRRLPNLNMLDPRTRVIAAVLFAVVVVGCRHIPVLAAALGVAVLLMLSARVPMRTTLRRMIAMDGFIIFVLVFMPFTMPGDTMFTVLGFEASWQGFHRAVEIGLTANAAILALMSLVGSLEPVTVGHALFRLRVPERLVHLMMFTVRYIEVLREEYQRLRQAMLARGFQARKNGLHTWRSFGYLIGMMLVRAVERSERILGAMKCRGFTGRFPVLNTVSWTRADVVFGVGFGAVLCALIVADILHGAV